MSMEGVVEPSDPRADRFVRRHGVSWADYERALEKRGEHSGPRITYLEGELQIMSPAFDHELIGNMVSRLVEAYCLDRDIDLLDVGAWTIKKRRVRRGAEADHCYIFGERRIRPERPDLAIEVVWTSGGIDKLDVWRKLGVREVWMWRKGKLQVYRLHGETYRAIPRSRFLPDLDLELLLQFIDRPSINRAVREFRAALAARK